MPYIPPRPADGDDPNETRAMQAFWDLLYDPKTSIFANDESSPLRFFKRADGKYQWQIRIGPGGTSSTIALYKITSIANLASYYVAAKKASYDNSNTETLAATAVSIAIPPAMRGTSLAVNDYIVVAEAPSGAGVAVSSLQLHLLALGGAGGSSTKKYRLKSIQKDYLTCRELTIDSGGTPTEGSTDIYVAKYPELRGSVTSETLDGVSTAYSSYATTTSITRVATPSGGSAEDQVIVPRFRPDSTIIFAFQVSNGTGVWRSGVELTWQEMSPRYWAYANSV